MRGKEHLEGSVVGFIHNSKGCTASEIFTRDTRDVRVSDIVFVYLTNYSIGTAFEIGLSWSLNKKIVIVTTPELIKHPFLSESADYITTDFYDGVNAAVRRYANFSN